MAEQDGQTVTTEVSTETPAPEVVKTPDMDEKIKAAVAEALKAKDEEMKRKIQSETDKRVAPFQRRLSDAEKRAQILEQQLANLPNSFGPDTDPAIRQQATLAALQGQVGYYRTREQQLSAERQIEEAKQVVFEDTKAEIEALGIDPDDPRLVFDTNAPDPQAFRRAAFASARAIQKAEREKEKAEADAREAKRLSDLEAKLRRDTGVDSHDSAGSAAPLPTFTREQIRDYKFYHANKEAILKAEKEGRIK